MALVRRSVLAAILLLAVACTTTGTLREDSARHLLLSAALAYEGTLVAHAGGLAPSGAAFVGGGTTLVLGVAKETWDTVAPDGTGWGWDDLLCDLVGSWAGSLLAYWLLSSTR